MRAIPCRHCDCTTYPLASVTVSLELSAGSYCEHCRHSVAHTGHLFFCSVACFLSFMEKTPGEVQAEADLAQLQAAGKYDEYLEAVKAKKETTS